LLGPSIDGLDKLLAMPYGCGEQNMLKFAPNVYIMDYLKVTHQSNAEIEAKAIRFMKSGNVLANLLFCLVVGICIIINYLFNLFVGYQRELTFKHRNGGYSAFGERDREASTW